MVSSLDVLTTREGKRDRTASVLGFWVSRCIALNGSSGKRTDRGRGCGFGSSTAGFAATNVRGVADERGTSGIPRSGDGTIRPGPSTG
jgi:hypothetical protein